LDFWLPGVYWVIEIILIIFIILFLWICVCIRSIRYFWKFPMPAIMGNVIAAGPYRSRVQPPSMVIEALSSLVIVKKAQKRFLCELEERKRKYKCP